MAVWIIFREFYQVGRICTRGTKEDFQEVINMLFQNEPVTLIWWMKVNPESWIYRK